MRVVAVVVVVAVVAALALSCTRSSSGTKLCKARADAYILSKVLNYPAVKMR